MKTLTTGNGGNTVTKGEPLPARRQFQPDYEVEHYKRETRLTPFGWVVVVVSIFGFVWAAINQFNH